MRNRSSHRSPRRLSVVVAALSAAAIALGMSGCGSSSDTTESETQSQQSSPQPQDSTAAPQTESSDAPSSGLQTVSVAITAFHALHLWAVIADDYKTMEPWGINLDLVIADSTAKVVPALISGDVQIATPTPNQLVSAYEQEPRLKFINQAIIGSPYVLVGRDGVNSLDDLKGKIIGVNAMGASADYFDIVAVLSQKGLVEGKDYTLVQTGGTPQRVAALSNDQVDATLLWEPDISRALQDGAHEVASLSDLPMLKNEMVNGFAALSSWYEANRETAERWIRGYEETIRFMQNPDNRDKVISSIKTAFNVDQELAERTYEQFLVNMPQQDPTGFFSEEPFRTTIKLAQDMDFEPVAHVDLDNLGQYYDNSLIEDAKSLEKITG